MHRWVWDLRATPPAPPAGGRSAGGGRSGALALPGSYTVRLTVNGKIYSQPLRVRRDPRGSQE